MNPDLIKQLELAYLVGKGEVPFAEIQRRLRHEYISSKSELHQWHAISGDHSPEIWNHKEYEYRRKPKLREWWCVELQNGEVVKKEFPDEAEALEWMETHDDAVIAAGLGTQSKRPFLMREVTND